MVNILAFHWSLLFKIRETLVRKQHCYNLNSQAIQLKFSSCTLIATRKTFQGADLNINSLLKYIQTVEYLQASNDFKVYYTTLKDKIQSHVGERCLPQGKNQLLLVRSNCFLSSLRFNVTFNVSLTSNADKLRHPKALLHDIYTNSLLLTYPAWPTLDRKTRAVGWSVTDHLLKIAF